MKRNLKDLPDYAPVDLLEIATLLHLGKSTLEEWIKEGRFPPHDMRIGRKRCWVLAKVRTWLAALVHKNAETLAEQSSKQTAASVL